MEQRIEEALANDQDISQLDTVKVPQGSTVSELAELLGVPAMTSLSACSCLAIL